MSLAYISPSVILHTGKACQKQSERAGCTVTKNGSASWGGIFDVDGKRRELQAREARMGEQGFWDDPERAREVIAEIKKLKEIVEPFDTLSTKVHELLEMDALIEQEPDDALSAEIEREVSSLDEQVPAFEVRSLLAGPDDRRDAMLEISAGAGGTEAQDWAAMLMRMYERWAARHGFEWDVLDMSEGEEAGIKGAMIEIRGPYAYGFLRPETGVHRLVRISPFDAQARRHTSFASVFIYPVVDETINIEIRDEDLRIDVYRASGAGGQHVNKTDSAVRITHLPTNIVVSSQNDRSQHRNRAEAFAMLKSKLYELELRKKTEKKQAMEDAKTDIGWGHQIRSYVLDQSRIKDLRTNVEIGNTQSVLDGDLDEFITASLKQGV